MLCAEDRVTKTLGCALGAVWGKAEHTTVCHLEERQDVQFKSAGNRSVMRGAWPSSPWEAEGETRGDVGESIWH